MSKAEIIQILIDTYGSKITDLFHSMFQMVDEWYQVGILTIDEAIEICDVLGDYISDVCEEKCQDISILKEGGYIE